MRMVSQALSQQLEQHPTRGRVLEVRITTEGMRLLERAQAAAKTVEDRGRRAAVRRGTRPAEQPHLHRVMQTLDIYLTGRS
jgi:hypothetical protein